jgi:hypothetical protein
MAGIVFGNVRVIWTSVTGRALCTTGLTSTTQVTWGGERDMSIHRFLCKFTIQKIKYFENAKNVYCPA